MIDITRHDDVEAVALSWWRSRLAGMRVHAFLVRGVLIDSGFPAVAREVARFVAERDVRAAMITHAHEDHAGNVELLASRGLPLGIGDETRALVSAPHPLAFYRRFTWTPMKTLRSPVTPFADDTLTLTHAPGHAPDHHVVWDARTHTVFAGDLFIGVKVRLAHAYADPRREVQVLRDVIAKRPARLFCAHRGLVPNPVAALEAKAGFIEDVIARVEARHAAGDPISRITRDVLGRGGFVDRFSGGEYSVENYVRSIVAPRRAA